MRNRGCSDAIVVLAVGFASIGLASAPAAGQEPEPPEVEPAEEPAGPVSTSEAGAEPAPATAAEAPEPAVPPTTSAGEEEPIPTLDELLRGEALQTAEDWAGPGAAGQRDYPWFEHHGYFRIRVDGYYRGHLGTSSLKSDGTMVRTSGFMPPLTENAANATSVNKDKVGPHGEDWLAGGNMRFRYRPTLHIAPSLAIHAELDVFDNLVLGSTPDYNPNRPDAPLSLFARSQAVPSAGRNSLKDSIRAKQAYVTWDILRASGGGGAVLTLSAGRMARHWGLGIVENDGEDLDANYGTYVDRVHLLTRVAGVYFEAGYGWVASGPTSESPRLAYGEPHDLTDTDDVTEITFAAFSKPVSDLERRARYERLHVRNQVCVDWGLYAVYRRQKLDVSAASATAIRNGDLDPAVPGGGYDQIALEPRNAWTLTPDLWVRLEWVPAIHKRLRLELEAAAVIGRIGQVQPQDPNSGMDIRSFGFAFEGEYQTRNLSLGLDTGLATGDTAEYFGVLDHTNYADPAVRNPRLAAFYFHPDYHLDNLLFRNVIGTVTNAFYFKPWIQYDLFEQDEDALAGRLDILYGRALEKTATPGDSANLGVETILKVFYEEKGLLYAGLEWSILWPLAAFDLIPSFEEVGVHKTSRWATALRARLGVMF